MTLPQLQELLDRCRAGEDGAWREFVKRFHPLIRGTVRKYSGDLVDDVVQLVYERLISENYRMLARFDGTFPAFLVYLQRIAQNVSTADIRRRSLPGRQTMNLDRTLELLVDGSPPVEEIVMAREVFDRLDTAIMDLPLEYREVVSHLYNGLNHRQVSEILSLPLGTVLTRATRAKEILRNALKVQIN